MDLERKLLIIVFRSSKHLKENLINCLINEKKNNLIEQLTILDKLFK